MPSGSNLVRATEMHVTEIHAIGIPTGKMRESLGEDPSTSMMKSFEIE